MHHASCVQLALQAKPDPANPDPRDRDFCAWAVASPARRQGGKRVHKAREKHTPCENGDMQDLLRRFSVLEQNQRDMLFLLRSMRVALFNARVKLSPETRRI